MRIAILGAGFSGLSVAWHLLLQKSCEITIYDPKGIGGGASGVATGLLHPYVGEQGQRSQLATEGLQAAKELIDTIEKKKKVRIVIQRGLVRYVFTDAQRQRFQSHCQEFGDVRPLNDRSFSIESGMTIDCPQYLTALGQALTEKGVQWIREEVSDLHSLDHFDQVIIAAGAGVKKFSELSTLPVSLIKGQILTCRAEETPLFASAIGKGYIAVSPDPQVCFVGSTYERDDLTDIPQVERAKSLLFEKIGGFFPAVNQLEVIDCRAALRVVRKGHYFPTMGKIQDKLWILTGMGSRGLLYHAYLGKQLAEAVLTDEK